MSKKTGIIGSGISGLAVAIRLAAKGQEAHVFEKNSWPGGKLSELRVSGFRFDMGPSLFTMPWLVDELFTLAGKNPNEHFSYEQLDILCNYFFEDGTIIKAFRNPSDFALEIENKTRDRSQVVLDFLAKAEHIYSLTHNVFINRALHNLSNLTQRSFLKAFVNIGAIDAFRSMHSRNAKTFNDSKTVRIFDRYATYTGSDPYQAPATLNMIAHLEHNTGAFFPEKGMYGIVSSLYELAISLGVHFHFDEPVKEILFTGRNATGIRTGTCTYHFNFIVSDVDVHSLYGNILKSKPAPIKPRNLSSSALVFYWGINKPFPVMDMHNILFSNNYKEEFRQLFGKQDVYIDPTVYIFISSRAVPSDAPANMENWFVMINVPPDLGQDWEKIIVDARRNIVQKINRMLETNIEDHIILEHILTPGIIEERTGSHRGSLYGRNGNSKMAAFNRHPNQIRKYRNLFFTGGSVHPGGGIPICLSSAKIVANEILKKTQ